jgi:putative chitinase
MITEADLSVIMPQAKAGNVALFVQPINDALDEFHINTPIRQAAFLAQIAHESGQLRYSEEIASGKAYEGRADLGNTSVGDGKRYKGRGLIQITGRANYEACGSALGVDLLAEPELLKQPDLAARSAAWFWFTHGCNELADAGKFDTVTRRINGGLNGYEDRVSFWERAKEQIA